MPPRTPDTLTEDERTNQISSAAAIIGTPTDGDDVITSNAGTDLLKVDDAGPDPADDMPARVEVRLGLGGAGPLTNALC